MTFKTGRQKEIHQKKKQTTHNVDRSNRLRLPRWSSPLTSTGHYFKRAYHSVRFNSSVKTKIINFLCFFGRLEVNLLISEYKCSVAFVMPSAN